MTTIDLNLLEAFVAVHQTGSFSLAAEQLKVPRSTVSRAIAALEDELDLRLFNRTTRSVSTTSAGKALYDRVSPALTTLLSSLEELPERAESPSGLLRITAPVDLGSILVAEAVARFTARYPLVRVEANITNEMVDLVRDGFDLAIRATGRPLKDSTLVARKLGTVAMQLYAAPSYLARKGTPRTVEDLQQHDWVGFRGFSPRFAPPPRAIGNDIFYMLALLRAGAGIGVLPATTGQGGCVEGALTRVLPKWVGPASHVYLVQPSKRHAGLKVTAFIELLDEMLKARPLGQPE